MTAQRRLVVSDRLADLGLSPPEERKPPPICEVVRTPMDDEGREIQAS